MSVRRRACSVLLVKSWVGISGGYIGCLPRSSTDGSSPILLPLGLARSQLNCTSTRDSDNPNTFHDFGMASHSCRRFFRGADLEKHSLLHKSLSPPRSDNPASCDYGACAGSIKVGHVYPCVCSLPNSCRLDPILL